MSVTISNYNQDIQFITIKVESGLEATLCNYGASVYALSLNNAPLILTLKDKQEFLDCPQFYGKTLGRVAGRIKGDVEIDGTLHHLKLQKGFDYSLHGGCLTSLSFKPWKYKIRESETKIVVDFQINDRDGANGFPGRANVHAIYTIEKAKPVLKINLKGSANKETLMNISNHMYFNFNNDLTISDYKLKMNCSKYGDVDETVFIRETKDIIDELDFRRSSTLGSKLNVIEKKSFLHTIDNTFIFDSIETRKPQAILKNDRFTLKLYTSFPVMNVYVDNSMVPHEFINNENMLMRRGIALEPQLYNFDLDSLRFKKGEKFNHFITYKFSEN